MTQARQVRCAIYTRKSVSADPLDDQNTLEVQREICAAFLKTQRHRGWVEVTTRYDDGGHSGGSLARPGLQRLLADVEEGLIDVIVIYKLDRLTRSLADFIRLIDLLDANGATFVSVTQSFDTQDSMGRLIVNVLLTFAQFEREMIADRVRDKMAQMKRAGRWTGGAPPYGYDLVDKQLVINEAEAAYVRVIFARYLELGSANALTEELRAAGLRAKSRSTRQGTVTGGELATRGMIYGMLGSPVYVGEFYHRGETFVGKHQPIIDRNLWDAVQAARNARRLKQPPARPQDNLLLGLAFDDVGRRMRMESGEKSGRDYRYYVSDTNHPVTKRGLKSLRATGNELEHLVHSGIASFLRDRSAVSVAVHALGSRDRDTDKFIDRGKVIANLVERWDRKRLRYAWEALIARIEVSREQVRVILRCEQVAALLAWPGTGIFRDRSIRTGKPFTVYTLELDAVAVRRERRFRLATDPLPQSAGKPKRQLVDLMRLARDVQAAVYENRQQTMEEIAPTFRRRPAFLTRVLRLNYLAPDIIAAIMDGRQPPGLNRRKLVFAALPTDWAQQRALLGFPAQWDPSPIDQHY